MNGTHNSGYHPQTASARKTDLLILTMTQNQPAGSLCKLRAFILCFDGPTDQYDDTVRAHFSPRGYNKLTDITFTSSVIQTSSNCIHSLRRTKRMTKYATTKRVAHFFYCYCSYICSGVGRNIQSTRPRIPNLDMASADVGQTLCLVLLSTRNGWLQAPYAKL